MSDCDRDAGNANVEVTEYDSSSAFPASNDVCKASCKFRDVPKGSLLSYQQRVKPSNEPIKVHINIEAPDPRSFTRPPVNQAYSTLLTMPQQNFIDGLQLSPDQANLSEKKDPEPGRL